MAEKILIIDDDVDTLRLVGMMLQRQGYRIVVANNGSQGLIQAENENPDLILLDVMMPEMDGYEVARRLRANPDTASIPILMFTAKSQLDDKVTGFEAGADDYLTKPTHPSELLAHVKALLARSTKGRPAAETPKAEQRAFTVGVLAARGGLGVSTVAANLGCSLSMLARADTIVAELRPGQGTLGADLGQTDLDALTQLLQANQSEITRQKVRDSLFTLREGISFLFASMQPRDAALMGNSAQIEILLNRLVYLASYLILDLGSGLPLWTQKLVKACQALVLVVEPQEASVQHARALIADLTALGCKAQSILPVTVHRVRSELQLNWTQVQEQLGYPVAAAIMPAPELLYQAARMKTTAVLYQADSLAIQQFALQFRKLTEAILSLEKQKA
jgi:CheY-like chemotaxis protein